jgi:outer membrane protein OmpA-like peptidoglycan-associated protein/curli biogenesis system outer membrane secretion channel CsgG
MWRGSSYFAALGAVVVLAVGTSASVVAQGEQDAQGDKARIAVTDMTSKSGDCSSDMASAIGEMLATFLVNTQRFIVLADAGAVGTTGVLVSSTITKFEPEAGGGGGLGGLKKKALGEVGIEEKTAELEMDLKLIDGGSGRVLRAKSIKTKSTDWEPDVSGGSWVEDVVLGGALGTYEGEPMEDAIRLALAQAVDVITDETPEDFYRYSGEEQSPAAAGTGAAAGAATAEVAEDMTLYTRYDFVPGNRVIFYDDMKDDEEGEFPYRWNLDRGVYEVVRLGSEFWIMATDNGSIRPKMPDALLPPKYTIELEFYDNGPEHTGNYFYIQWVDDQGSDIGEFGIVSSSSTWLSINGKSLASKNLSKDLAPGLHTMRIMATARTIKCFIDEERVANVPRVEGFDPVGFRLHHRPYRDAENPTLFRGFRFAEGGKSMREQLDEDGKIVTHGILFDSDSHKIKGESYRTLRDIGQMLQDDPELRLSIEGHTDSDGSDEHNTSLSHNRANSVRDYLISTYDIDPNRLEAKGWGQSQPIDTNDTPEGKANNRRVELIGLS